MATRSLTTEEMQALYEWHQLATEIKSKQAKERQMREQIAYLLVSNGSVGTHRFAISEKISAKVKFSESVKLSDTDPEKLKTVYGKLVEAGLTPEEAGSLVKTKLELSVGAYNKLSAKHQVIMSAVVETKPSTPTIEIDDKTE